MQYARKSSGNFPHRNHKIIHLHKAKQRYCQSILLDVNPSETLQLTGCGNRAGYKQLLVILMFCFFKLAISARRADPSGFE